MHNAPKPLPASRPGRRQWLHRLVITLLMGIGIAFSLQPVASTISNDVRGAGPLADYREQVAQAPAEKLNEQLAKAQAYNAALPSGAIYDPWDSEDPAPNTAHDEYLNTLAAFEVMARIRIPQIDVDLPVLHDASDASMSKGAGHMYGTSLPVGGVGSHAVIAAHTGWVSRTFFDRLTEVREGDLFHIDVAGITLTYRIDQISLVLPTQLESIRRVPEADLVTLVTCESSAGLSSHRLLVRGVRVADERDAGPEVEPATQAPTGGPPVERHVVVQEWMRPRLAIGGVAAVLLGVMFAQWVITDIRAWRRAAVPGEGRAAEQTDDEGNKP